MLLRGHRKTESGRSHLEHGAVFSKLESFTEQLLMSTGLSPGGDAAHVPFRRVFGFWGDRDHES